MSKKYVFPLNYTRREKLLGIIDYKTMIILLVYGASLFYILKNIQIAVNIRVLIFASCFTIPAIFLIVGINGESSIEFIIYAVKYMVRSKIYVYRKETPDEINKSNKLLASNKLYRKWINKN